MSYVNITVFWFCRNFLDKESCGNLLKKHIHFVEPVKWVSL